MHKELLCSKSRFFKACFTSGFAETTSSTVELPEDSTNDVEMFIEWLYHGAFQVGLLSSKEPNTASAYAFATKIGADAYCNAIIDALLKHLKENKRGITILGLRQHYEAGCRDTPMGRFVLKSAVHYTMTLGQGDGLTATLANVKDPSTPRETLADMLSGIMEFRSKPWTDPNTWPASEFHVE